MATTWEELGAMALARQFPGACSGVADAVRRIGPIQSQTARSPFLALAARFPGTTHEQVSASYEQHAIVRGSTIRGTVHTTVPEHHALLEVATRTGQRAGWSRALGRDDVEPLWRSLESFAGAEWRTPAELLDHLRGWAAAHTDTDTTSLETGFGRYLAFGHGGLVRRPVSGGWEGQGRPAYRTAAALLGDRSAVLASPTALDDLVRVHLSAHGPASRRDLAWWAGLPLRVVDDVLDRLALESVPGPDGERYVDLPSPPAALTMQSVRLLPEFDGLMCAYAPAARLRFMSVEHAGRLWNLNNGLVSPPILVDGRISGCWRAAGTARRRPLEVSWFAGTRRPRKAELEEPVAAVEAALGITVTGLTITRETV